jgi:flagellar basal-body rod protein FlgG
MRSLSIAATGMLAQQLNVEVISNNIANLNTNAFKAQRAEFQDLLYQDERAVGANSSDSGTIVPVGVQIGTGVKAAAVYRQGHGYLQVQMPDGSTSYTRDGSLQLSATGQLITADGYAIQPAITIPQNTTSITINANGQVMAQVAGQTAPQTVGQLELANFPNEAGLAQQGNNLLTETPASGAATTGNPGTTAFGTIQQGFIETSNVNIVSEITNLISAQRAYEMNSKVIQTSDQMMSTLNQIQ